MTSHFYARSGPISSPVVNVERVHLRALRASIEDELGRLFSILDAIDGDPDLEPEEDDDTSDLEPSLGWSNTGAYGLLSGNPQHVDLEEEHVGREPDEDFEGNTDDNGIGDRGGLDEQYGIDATVTRFPLYGTLDGTLHIIPER